MATKSKTKIAYPIPQGVECIRAKEDFGVPIVPAPDKETALEWFRTCVPDEAVAESQALLEQVKAGATSPRIEGERVHTIRPPGSTRSGHPCDTKRAPAYIFYVFFYLQKYIRSGNGRNDGGGVGQPTRLNTSTRTAKTAKREALPKGLHHARTFLPTLHPRVFPAHARLWLAIVAKAGASKETAIRVSQEIDALAEISGHRARQRAVNRLEKTGMVRVVREPGKRPTLVLKFHAGFPVALNYDPAATSKGPDA